MGKANINIDEKTLEEVVKRVLNESEKQQKERAKKKRDRRLRNTDLLLRNYDNLITHIDYAVEDEKKLEEEDPEEVLDELEREMSLSSEEDYEGIYINAIKRTKIRTRIISKHIKTAIEFYKHKAKDDSSYARRYNVIYKYYFEKKSITDIAEELYIAERTAWRDRNKAIEELSVLFFGIDGIKFLV
ncbi:hypothetical protein [Clostridium intestinale]|uniref:Uncharacterized protein n=1 Tax=Clostridium intestinale TaxID=36845 RepID=A0A7D6ZZ99_9CLOT|nr:hypothetical protein [Clostridium intestinale]QLY79195.1 hypothetical protein HZF06_19275 [Clostridium intestinale]